jgi:pyroglutamyl-peptidase
MTRVLVTAFEPFGGESVNPSQLAAARLAVNGIAGSELVTGVLPVAYYDARDAIYALVATHDPDIVICTGEAGGRFGVTPEKIAVNRNDTAVADNAGNLPVDEPIVADGPDGYFTGLPVAATVEALRDAGIPAELSWTAGTYVCNHVFYSLMHLVATQRPALRGGFVHVPYTHQQVVGRRDPQPSLSLESITEALGIVVATAVSTQVDRTVAVGPAPTP